MHHRVVYSMVTVILHFADFGDVYTILTRKGVRIMLVLIDLHGVKINLF